MNNRIEEAQEDEKGQEQIEFEDDTNENPNIVEPQVTSEEHVTASSGESQIEKPRPETDDEDLASSVETRASAPSVSSAAPQQQPNQGIQSSADSKFFAIRTTGGQERVVANLLQTRANAKKLLIRSVIVLDSFKGYIIVEAPDSNVAYEALAGIRHVRGQIRGDLPFKDIEGYLVKKPVVSELSTDDTVEVIAGPFKSMKAKITRVDYEKQEATVVLLDSPYQIPVTVDANYLKRLAH
ncbi:MAG TPA: transcription elongation factor Spt5 [Nitrososphaera sp.]|jgi:transcription termination/antitermination protein NusG|nr:transcription elongation factor Spt5 [Nitrososphaera sp.]